MGLGSGWAAGFFILAGVFTIVWCKLVGDRNHPDPFARLMAYNGTPLGLNIIILGVGALVASRIGLSGSDSGLFLLIGGQLFMYTERDGFPILNPIEVLLVKHSSLISIRIMLLGICIFLGSKI
jgi:hypothetical protein